MARTVAGRTPAVLVLSMLTALSLTGGCGGSPGTGNADVVGPGSTAIQGLVVDSANTGQAVGNAYVYVTPRAQIAVGGRGEVSTAADRPDWWSDQWQTDGSGGSTSGNEQAGVVAATHTAADGSYTLAGVPEGEHTITIVPLSSSGYARELLDVQVPTQGTVAMRMTVTDEAVARTVVQVQVTPTPQSVPRGKTRQFTATVLNGSGETVPLVPSWVVTGGIGSVNEAGLFTATTAGSGRVTAVVAGKSGSASVTVTQSAIADPGLEAAVRENLGNPTGDLTIAQLKGMSGRLDAKGRGIENLSGIENCTGLTGLDVQSNAITDAVALASLTQLTYLNVSGNQLTDLDFASTLTSLVELYAAGNQIADVSGLAGLDTLAYVYLPRNDISDVSPLAGLDALAYLDLSGNSVSDLSPLAQLHALTNLYLSHNSISDVSPLAGVSGLTDLALSANSISDLSGLAGMSALEYLDLSSNSITDLSGLAGLGALRDLYLSRNDISDLSALAGLSHLADVVLSNNNITDLAALASNQGIARGDNVNLAGNPLDLTAGSDAALVVAELVGRGVRVVLDSDPTA